MIKEVITDALLEKSGILKNLGRQSTAESPGIGCKTILSTLKEIQVNTAQLLFPQLKRTVLRLSNVAIIGAKLIPGAPVIPQIQEPLESPDIQSLRRGSPRMRDAKGRFISSSTQVQSGSVKASQTSQEAKSQEKSGEVIAEAVKESLTSKIFKNPIADAIKSVLGITKNKDKDGGNKNLHGAEKAKDAAGLAIGGPIWDAYKEIQDSVGELKESKGYQKSKEAMAWAGEKTGLTAFKDRQKENVSRKLSLVRDMAVQRFKGRQEQEAIQEPSDTGKSFQPDNVNIPQAARGKWTLDQNGRTHDELGRFARSQSDHFGGDSSYHKDEFGTKAPGIDPREGTKPIIDSLKSSEQNDEERHKELIVAIKGIKPGDGSGAGGGPGGVLRSAAKKALPALSVAAGPAALIAAMGGMALAGKKRMDEHPDEAAQMADWGGAEGASMNLGNKDAWKPPDKTQTTPTPSDPTPSAPTSSISTTTPATPPGLGSLSAQYESAAAGSKAIGWDKGGGTSYGKYQIASKVGTMNEFVKYLDKRDPEAAAQLRASGPLDTGSKKGASVDTWQKLEKEGRLKDYEHSFIKETHFDPQAAKIKKESGLDVSGRSKALQDAVWSTSVQHGANTSVVTNALKKTGKGAQVSDAEAIDAIYAERERVFPTTAARYKDERKKAQAQLAAETSSKKALVSTQKQEPKPQEQQQQPLKQEATPSQQQVAPTTTAPSVIQQQEPVQPAPIVRSQQVEPPQRITPTEQAQPTRPGPWDPAAAQRQESLSSTSKIEGLLQQLITVQQQKQPEPDPKGEKAMNIPTEFDDTTLTLMAYDRI